LANTWSPPACPPVSPAVATTAKPAAERLVILARHAEQVGDYEQRERLGVRVAELDLAAVAELVDQRVGELPHERLVLLEAVRREQTREQCAVARVLGRIEREELARERDLVAAVRDDVGDRLALGGSGSGTNGPSGATTAENDA
jgi:hypothetical protein